ncbi:MAG: 5-(carboxyamino)imidazole ribonucleotide synthase [Alphaproteobacteria bacterium]|nr:MAG: 5-(carboxyamino)imidazole ribonucleotide synthase [Alphaproteobacteria bacterium]
MAEPPLPPGSTIGILGGGQLGRMLSMAAARLGMRAHIYAPEPDPPAGHVAHRVTTAGWDDHAALDAFAATVDVVTLEFENIPVETLHRLASSRPVRPGPGSLEVSQDRLAEKRFLNAAGIATARFHPVDGEEDIARAIVACGAPGILKTRRLGYDGKGQIRIEAAGEAGAAWSALGRRPAIYEAFVDFGLELSVVAARGRDGAVACFDPAENRHEAGILRRSTVPGAVSAAQRVEAALIAGRILNALDHVGVMGVEFFAAGNGLLVNEIAPRVHNSGHWTIEACTIDQFEQHIRAICGWPLGDGARHADAVMENLIGAEAGDWPRIAADPAAALHLYGKDPPRPGRKMGHVTRIRPRG